MQSPQDNSKVLLDEQSALWGGVVVTVLVGLPAALFAIGTFVSLVDDIIWVAIATWLVWMMIQFWISEAYKGGLTGSEIVRAALWPYDMYKTIRAGVRKQAGKPFAGTSSDPNSGNKLLKEEQALWAGIIVSVITVILLIAGIVSAITVIGGLIWLAVLVYVVGLFIQYWVSNAYTEGLTVNELMLAVAWPVATFKTIKEGVKARREAGQA